MSANAQLTFVLCTSYTESQTKDGAPYIKATFKSKSEEIYPCNIWEDSPCFYIAKKILRKGDYYNLNCSIKQKLTDFIDESGEEVTVPVSNYDINSIEWIDLIKKGTKNAKPQKVEGFGM